ncbi:MAG: hypothetical protein DHS20C18_50200 [Saprospiraceae bacterium]|nr:MAG: hypothetical protein DHS20C18_50200 [Saprospiraceae bacterium]
METLLITQTIPTMKNLFLFTLCIIFSTSCFATTITWNGGTGKWTRASQWSPAQVPGPNDDVIIPSGFVHLLNGQQTVKSLHLQSGRLYIAQGKSLRVQQSQSSRPIENNGTIENYGTLEIINPTQNFTTGLYNTGTFINGSSASLLIQNVTGWGFHTLPGGYANNQGDWTIDNASIIGLWNEEIFVSLSEINIVDCGSIGLFNEGSIINQDLLMVSNTGSTGIFNEGQIDNTSIGTLQIVSYGTNGIENRSSGLIENDGGSIIFGGTSGSNTIFNSGDIFNLDCGEIHINKTLRNLGSGLFRNQAWLFSTSTTNHVSTINATFINNGVIHDPEDAFTWVNMQNNGIIVLPFQGSVFVNQPVVNALGLGSLNGFNIHYWLDPTSSFKVGSYNENNNEFTPNSSSLGLTSIQVQIYFGSCGNRYLTIPIPGGIQASPSPLVTPGDTQQFPISSSAQNIDLFPNPAHDFVTIKSLTSESEIYQIQIFDASGKLVETQTPKDQINKVVINVQNLPSGLYWIKVVGETGELKMKKLMVE